MQQHTEITTKNHSAEELKAIADSLTNMMRDGTLVASNPQAWKQSKEVLAALYALSDA